MAFLLIVLVVMASRPTHLLKLWLSVGKGMLPVKYFHFEKYSLSVEFHDYETVTMLR